MIYILLGIAGFIFIWAAIFLIRNSTAAQIASFLRWVGLLLAIAVGALLIVFNKISLIWTILPLLFPWLSPSVWVGRVLRHIFIPSSQDKKGQPWNREADKGEHQRDDLKTSENAEEATIISERAQPMARAEALMILNLGDNPQEIDIHHAFQSRKAEIKASKSADIAKRLELLRRAYDSLIEPL
ncbi:MAG: hypothetical protein AB8B77_07565 [Alphaproteobacteria bacterium]